MLLLLIRIRFVRKGLHQVRYMGYRVLFRTQDEIVLKEVLADDEYVFASGCFGDLAEPRILDLGAHIGTFSLWCLCQMPSARILCVEANPDTFRILKMNAHHWMRTGAQLRVVHAAASGRSGELVAIREGATSSMSSRVDGQGTLVAHSLSFPALIELFVPEGSDVDLAKIDIEGSEEELICSHPEALLRIRTLIVELHPDLCDAGMVRAILERTYPFVVEVGRRTSGKPLLYCRR